jgi:exopolyphosphatase/guanosine-5'-triphosphate,3'-diphosphate pyrophosphatase
MPKVLEVQSQQHILAAVTELAKTCKSEYDHVTHVSNLTLRLFDELADLHHLEAEDRFQLQCASILHDIGWVEGWKNHHKIALRIILDTPMLPVSNRERLIIGSIARYHRKALPSISHDHFASLIPQDRKKVQILSSFLRLADGLDKTHQGKIREVHCKIKKQKITLLCSSAFPAIEEQRGGAEKADLLSLVFDREVIITIETFP